MYDGVSAAIIGATTESQGRIVKFTDGSLMPDLSFQDSPNSLFSDVYNSNSKTYCMRLGEDGEILGCESNTYALIFCEKSLFREKLQCLNSTHVGPLLTYDDTLERQFERDITVSSCIEHCRGNDVEFASISGATCQCGKLLRAKVLGKQF